MSTLYPSLEDMKVHHMLTAKDNAEGPQPMAPALGPTAREMPEPPRADDPPVLYPDVADLNDYMGLSLSSEEIQRNLALIPTANTAVGPNSSAQGPLVAPVTGSDAGLRRAEIKPGLREIHLCKDEHGKTGVHLRNIDKGLFVQLVKANSPASLVGLRFGDQILQINGRNCAGWNMEKAKRALKKASPEKIVMVVRDRPFQRTVTMHKDSTGHLGFVIKKGQITSLARDSSAARNGLLTHHYICEVNGQNVIGLKDKEITEILENAGKIITLTIVPAVIYEHMIKKLAKEDRGAPGHCDRCNYESVAECLNFDHAATGDAATVAFKWAGEVIHGSLHPRYINFSPPSFYLWPEMHNCLEVPWNYSTEATQKREKNK